MLAHPLCSFYQKCIWAHYMGQSIGVAQWWSFEELGAKGKSREILERNQWKEVDVDLLIKEEGN